MQELSRAKDQKTHLTNDLVKVKEDYRKSMVFLETGDWEDKVKEDRTKETKYVKEAQAVHTSTHIGIHVHCMYMYVRTYIRTNIHTCIHTYIHTFVHTYVHTHTDVCLLYILCMYILFCIHTYLLSIVCSGVLQAY